ncbi:MAG TPA: demethoxyubiquinone hydroxylase family protein [Caulobacteraceae bacterium]|nr:demethoxyubiquinone hydroxylase family protein [Caulobacteraceae bacterium]
MFPTTDPAKPARPARKPVPPRPGPGADKARLDEILRVDHAGETAAVHIYRAQAAVFAAAPSTAALSRRMAALQAQEAEHLAAFDALLTQHRTRPSLLSPMWRLAAFALGAGTALLGEKAAHACTEAVEAVIEAHYAGQVSELQDSEPELAATLARFRDDELAHQVDAVEQGAREAPAYPLLTAAIRAGCRAAIKTAEKL